jgi:phosphoenolpyruvate carboxykinase (ATP)
MRYFKHIYHNFPTKKLVGIAKENGCATTKEGVLTMNTGKFTGRSPKDRYFVEDVYSTQKVDFSRKINQKISIGTFRSLKRDLIAHMAELPTYLSDKFAGNNKKNRVAFTLYTSNVMSNIFFNNMLIESDSKDFMLNPNHWNIYHSDTFITTEKYHDLKDDNFVIISFETKEIIIGGTAYTGEIKKSVFTVLNTILLDKGILPMHCSASSVNKNGILINLFFGLSGTGKTTLSSDPYMFFIGDDEHGWDGDEVFNFEGGCYAKLANLSKDKEPLIYNAMYNKDNNSAILENVIMDEDGNVDFKDLTITENTRVSYPLDHIDNKILVEPVGMGSKVQNIFFLCFDAYGVLPPVVKLDKKGAMFFFELGYTSKVAGTEVGIDKPTLTFSNCFGDPFLPASIDRYVNLFGKKLDENPDINVWMINTGLMPDGDRYDLEFTRHMVRSIISGYYSKEMDVYNEDFGMYIPTYITDYKRILNPLVEKDKKDLLFKELYSKLEEKYEYEKTV